MIIDEVIVGETTVINGFFKNYILWHGNSLYYLSRMEVG